jgi:pyruvate dehydrogenase E2 component (dihydrolipoamide acetyltransferase)
MSIEFKLPSIGEGVTSADVAQIMVQPGDSISAGQVVMELETEKAVVELPCPHAGKLEKLLVKAGDSIQVGQAIMTIEANGAPAAKSAPAPAKPAAAPAKSDSPKPASKPTASPSTASEKSSGATGPIEFTVPSLGEGVSQADVAELLVKIGDTITAGQMVAELETEKAVVELPCPHAGKVTAVHVKEGDTIKVGAKFLTVEGSTAAAPSKPAASPSPAAGPAKQTATKSAPAAEKQPALTPTTTITVAETNGSDPNRAPAPAAPSTRRLARELGVNLHDIAGTGPGGRITTEDVQGYVRNRLQGLSVPSGKQQALAPMTGSIAPPPLPDFSRFGPIERQALSKIGRVAAENLTVSWNVIPHVTQHDLADITDLEAARKRFVAGLGKNGPKVTMTAIVMKALSTCLQAFPKFNASLDPITSEIVFKKYYNIGCAVDTEHGLVVPVIKDCDTKSIMQIAADVNGLAEKARDRKLPIDAMQGATCTVTNLGGIGGIGFTPIVNYPEVCILGMSRSQMQLRLSDGKVEERMMMPLSLSYDHRVINGADAARFLVALCNMLSDPFSLLTTI